MKILNRESFGKTICNFIFTRNELDIQKFAFNSLSDKVKINLNVFGTCIKDWIC